ncbi:hypothetical protein [Salinibaculum rarum]|uniref:hypothetical protein n=1 Tax=Salinibaculum rarum TaxID=3058903 RepID=UPI00265E26BD|nr:hypothetical protein [Salinibaculum sp. KK48]
MKLTTDKTESTATAIVAVRVPRDSGADVVTATERRIVRADGVTEVTIDGLRGMEPRLSATIVTVAVTIRTSDSTAIVDRLTEVHGIESVDHSDQ